MRVITGTAKGMRLKTLEGLETRPTTDRVKESIFNIIQFDIEGRRVLDLFAGSGQMAIEALSRGAKNAVILDNRSEAVGIIRENLQKTKLLDKSKIIQKDAAAFLTSAGEQFDVIFLDPPYNSNYLSKSLQIISEIDILTKGGIIIVERPSDKPIRELLETDFSVRDYKYGKTTITIITRL